MSQRTLGSCSNCGGPVRVPTAFMSVNPPVPTCSVCHATAKPLGGVVAMNPAPSTTPKKTT